MTAIAFNRLIGPVPIDCVVAEQHTSELEITEIPVESGVRITDHAFVLPKRVRLDIATENAAASYNALVAFQESRVPFVVVTGLYAYTNMLIKTLSADRDKTFSTVLKCSADLQEIIIVSTGYAVDTTGSSSSSQNSSTSTNSASPKLNSQNTTDAATADRVSGTTLRGDTGATTVQDTSVLSRVFQ